MKLLLARRGNFAVASAVMPSWVMLRAVLFVTLRSTSCPNHSRKFVSLKDCGSPLPPPSSCCHAVDDYYDPSPAGDLGYLLHKHPGGSSRST